MKMITSRRPRNPIAKAVRTPLYKMRVVKSKRRKLPQNRARPLTITVPLLRQPSRCLSLGTVRVALPTSYWPDLSELFANSTSFSGVRRSVSVTSILSTPPQETIPRATGSPANRYWLKDKSGYYSDGRLCVKVHAPDRPYLFIDPSGSDDGRYVAPLG